jgi:hypothetical protein
MDAVVAGADRPGDDNARVLAALRRSFLLQLLILALALIATTTVIGLVSLWPDGSRRVDPNARNRQATERATVDAVRRVDCHAPGRFQCARVTVRLRSGPDKGEQAQFTIGERPLTCD